MIAVKQSTLTCKIQDFPSSRLDAVVVVYSYDCLLLYLCAVTGLNCLLSLKRYEGVALYRCNCVQLFGEALCFTVVTVKR